MTRRLFVASWPTDGWRAEYGAALPKLEWASGGRRVAVANYHLTFAFLGPVADERIDAVRSGLGHIKANAFDVALDRLEYWPKPKVLCLVASVLPEPATALVGELWRALVRLGFKQDVRPYKAHLTLARHVERRPQGGAIDPIAWPVERIALVESTASEDGVTYTPLAFWPFTSSST
ncbi:MAG TPA: RNA 2',3'-cyclic phosphodiesterase [Steroidobacteraceae bacterium]|nr:RNA 2',3'-cyclic phosphodiesterase [Steroidobacteraceae bacterium]